MSKASFGGFKPIGKVTSFLDEFKAFALKGNMIDLAVAVIIGSAFGKVVDSLVKDVILPLIAAIFGKVDSASYANWAWREVHYGKFIAEVANFLIVALAVFVMIVKVVGFLQRLRKTEAVEPAAEKPVPEDIALLTEIRDLLKSRS